MCTVTYKVRRLRYCPDSSTLCPFGSITQAPSVTLSLESHACQHNVHCHTNHLSNQCLPSHPGHWPLWIAYNIGNGAARLALPSSVLMSWCVCVWHGEMGQGFACRGTIHRLHSAHTQPHLLCGSIVLTVGALRVDRLGRPGRGVAISCARKEGRSSEAHRVLILLGGSDGLAGTRAGMQVGKLLVRTVTLSYTHTHTSRCLLSQQFHLHLPPQIIACGQTLLPALLLSHSRPSLTSCTALAGEGTPAMVVARSHAVGERWGLGLVGCAGQKADVSLGQDAVWGGQGAQVGIVAKRCVGR